MVFGVNRSSSRWMFSLCFLHNFFLTDPNDLQMMEMVMNGTRGGEAHFSCPVTVDLSQSFYWKFEGYKPTVVDCFGIKIQFDNRYKIRGKAFQNCTFTLKNLTDEDAGSYHLYQVIENLSREVCTRKLQVTEKSPARSPGSHHNPAGDQKNSGVSVGVSVGAVVAVGAAVTGFIICY